MLKLFRRADKGNFYIRGTVAGCRVYESTGVSHRPTADAIRIRRESELLARRAYGKAQTLTFAEAALSYMQGGGESRFMARILHHFGPDTLIDDVDNAMINDLIAKHCGHLAPATINRQVITPISAVVNMAADEGLTRLRKFKRRKVPKMGKIWITPEEAERLINAASDHLRPILFCLLGTGARTSEVLGLDAAFYYPNTNEAWLPDTKNGHPRMLRMPERAARAIDASNPPDVGPIFLTPKGKPYVLRQNGGGQIAKAFNDARDAAGIDPAVTPHKLRHTWATWYYAATRDFGGLLDLGGWEKPEMAQGYRKIAPADLADRLLAHGWDFENLDTRRRAALPKPTLLISNMTGGQN